LNIKFAEVHKNELQLTPVYRKESFHSQESDSKRSSEYIFRLLGRHHQLCEVHEVQNRIK